MCLHPIQIKNPNHPGPGLRRRHLFFFDKLEARVDTISSYIMVPCGKCHECVMQKQGGFVQRVRLMAENHDVYMLTMTYSEEAVSHIDINGYDYKYANVRDVQNFFKMIRKYNVFGCDFKFMVFSEYGGKRHRPHWHALIFLPRSVQNDKRHQIQISLYAASMEKKLWSYWRRNLGSTRNPKWQQLCKYIVYFDRTGKVRKTFDFHAVVSYEEKGKVDNGYAAVSTYVTKYLFKLDKWILRCKAAIEASLISPYRIDPVGVPDRVYKKYQKKREEAEKTAKAYWDFLRPRMLISKHLGDDRVYYPLVYKGIKLSCQTGNCPWFWIDPDTGKRRVLSRYLVSKFVTFEDQRLRKANSDEFFENERMYEFISQQEIDKIKAREKLIAGRNEDILEDFIFEEIEV